MDVVQHKQNKQQMMVEKVNNDNELTVRHFPNGVDLFTIPSNAVDLIDISRRKVVITSNIANAACVATDISCTVGNCCMIILYCSFIICTFRLDT